MPTLVKETTQKLTKNERRNIMEVLDKLMPPEPKLCRSYVSGDQVNLGRKKRKIIYGDTFRTVQFQFVQF